MKSFHRYPFPASLGFWVVNLAAGFLIFLGIYSFVTSIFDIQKEILFVSLVMFFMGVIAIFCGHLYSEIISDDEGVLVRFLFWRLRVRWDDIIDVKPAPMNVLIKPLSKVLSVFTTHIVKTKALTPFHRSYGLYVFSLHPSFLIHSNISGFEELLSSVENKKPIQTSEKLAA